MSRITDEMIALMKGMLARGDKNQDIAACFGENQARVAEVKRAMTDAPQADDPAITKRARGILTSAPDDLPPPAPYPTPYQLFKAGHSVWAARVALEHTKEKIDLALIALAAAEIKP